MIFPHLRAVGPSADTKCPQPPLVGGRSKSRDGMTASPAADRTTNKNSTFQSLARLLDSFKRVLRINWDGESFNRMHETVTRREGNESN